MTSCFLFGVPGAIRTRGLSLRRRTLYPAELRRHICGFAPRKNGTRQEELYRSRVVIVNQARDEFGAARGDRFPLRPVGAAVRRMVKLR